MKRILSIVLSVMLLLGSMSLTVMAEDPLNLTLSTTTARSFASNSAVVAGSKVMFNPIAVDDAYTVKYYNNGVEVTPEVAPDATKIMFTVNAGENAFTAKMFEAGAEVEGTESAPVNLYGVTFTSGEKNVRTDKISADKTADLKAVIEANEDAAAVATAKAVLEYNDETGTYGRTATVHNPAYANAGSSTRMSAYYTTGTPAEGIAGETFEVLEISFDILIADETLSSNAYAFGMLGYQLDSTSTYPQTSFGTYYKISKDTLELRLRNDYATGVKLTPKKWHNIKYIYNSTNITIDVYVNGVLAGKNLPVGIPLDSARARIIAPYSASSNSSIYLSNITFDATMKYVGRKTLDIAADDTTNVVTVTAEGLTTEEVYLYVDGAKAATPLTFTDGVATQTINGFAEVYAAVVDEDGKVVVTELGEALKTDTIVMTDANVTDIIVNPSITETGARLGILKANLPAEDQTKKITVFAFAEDGSIATKSFTFGANDTYKGISFDKAGIEKIFVWKLAEMKAIAAPITK